MAEVEETKLPGLGIRYEFLTSRGSRIGVVHHRTGRRELFVHDQDDDTSGTIAALDEDDSRTLAELLGGSRVGEQLANLQQRVEGIAIDWLPIAEGTPFAGKSIGDTRARTLTGTSIVAIVRGEDAVPAPGPEHPIEAGDTLVVVGTPRGIEQLAVILRTG
ncbi:MAG TPA: cation:proton antiporter regulatory subunit [Actinomycetota bacterium]